jgi:peptidoglycan hydrolase CwlO-like protein
MTSPKRKLTHHFRTAIRCSLIVASIGGVSLYNNPCNAGIADLSILAQSDLLGLASTDRVLTSHEKRLEQLKKELETIHKDIVKEEAHQRDLEQEITHLNENLNQEKSNGKLIDDLRTLPL